MRYWTTNKQRFANVAPAKTLLGVRLPSSTWVVSIFWHVPVVRGAQIFVRNRSSVPDAVLTHFADDRPVAGRPALRLTAPIVQIVAVPHGHILIRTITTVLVGEVSASQEDDVPYHVRIVDRVHTGRDVSLRQRDACVLPTDIGLVDSHGTVRLWDVVAQHTTRLTTLPCDDADRFWAMAPMVNDVLAAASCYTLHTIDRRVSL